MECPRDAAMHAPLQGSERASPPPARGLAGALHFAGAGERSRLVDAWRASFALVVVLDAIAPRDRGRLRDAVDRAIERELDAHGAPGPGLTAWAEGDGALSDQLFRARRLGRAAIALCFGPLDALVDPTGAIGPEDTATLRLLAAATRDRPLLVALDAGTRRLRAHADPVPLAPLLEPARAPRADSAPHAARRDAAERVVAGELVVPGEGVVAGERVVATERVVPAEHVAPAERVDAVAAAAPSASVEVAACSVEAERDGAATHGQPAAPAGRARARVVVEDGAVVATPADVWRSWALSLGAARGPQPLSAFERLFKESYVPLEHAVAGGLDDPRARHAVDDFRRSFARAYTEAFPTFAVTGKRPKMVLDAPDIAGRLARLHGARATQLVLVDGMRWDVGAMVRRELSPRLGDTAVHAEEMLLFSALPTHTPSQLDAIARGMDALRDRDGRVWEEEPPRGRTAEVLRRTRIGGGRDLYRLDLVEARTRAAGAHARAELPTAAAAVADVVARHAATLTARTLLFVFGDHGFTCDAAGVARHGGASPEEVLVPAHAFVVGAVH